MLYALPVVLYFRAGVFKGRIMKWFKKYTWLLAFTTFAHLSGADYSQLVISIDAELERILDQSDLSCDEGVRDIFSPHTPEVKQHLEVIQNVADGISHIQKIYASAPNALFSKNEEACALNSCLQEALSVKVSAMRQLEVSTSVHIEGECEQLAPSDQALVVLSQLVEMHQAVDDLFKNQEWRSATSKKAVRDIGQTLARMAKESMQLANILGHRAGMDKRKVFTRQYKEYYEPLLRRISHLFRTTYPAIVADIIRTVENPSGFAFEQRDKVNEMLQESHELEQEFLPRGYIKAAKDFAEIRDGINELVTTKAISLECPGQNEYSLFEHLKNYLTPIYKQVEESKKQSVTVLHVYGRKLEALKKELGSLVALLKEPSAPQLQVYRALFALQLPALFGNYDNEDLPTCLQSTPVLDSPSVRFNSVAKDIEPNGQAMHLPRVICPWEDRPQSAEGQLEAHVYNVLNKLNTEAASNFSSLVGYVEEMFAEISPASVKQDVCKNYIDTMKQHLEYLHAALSGQAQKLGIEGLGDMVLAEQQFGRYRSHSLQAGIHVNYKSINQQLLGILESLGKDLRRVEASAFTAKAKMLRVFQRLLRTDKARYIAKNLIQKTAAVCVDLAFIINRMQAYKESGLHPSRRQLTAMFLMVEIAKVATGIEAFVRQHIEGTLTEKNLLKEVGLINEVINLYACLAREAIAHESAALQ